MGNWNSKAEFEHSVSLPTMDEARESVAKRDADVSAVRKQLRKRYNDALERGDECFTMPINPATDSLVQQMRARGWNVEMKVYSVWNDYVFYMPSTQ